MPRNRIIAYQRNLRTRARALRKNGTLGEVLLWRELQGRRLQCQFHRQVPIDAYIVDFYCHELRLAIELDGSSHDHEAAFEYDMRRQERLEALGVRVVRFREQEVRSNLAGVVGSISEHVAAARRELEV